MKIITGRFAVTKDFDEKIYKVQVLFYTQKDVEEGTCHEFGVKLPWETFDTKPDPLKIDDLMIGLGKAAEKFPEVK